MMKKITKRIFALMLAVIMAVPVLLVAPFSAQAEAGYHSHLLAHYFIDNNFTKDNWSGYDLESVNNGTYYWRNGGVLFPGGSPKKYFRTRVNNMLSGVDFSNGFTVTFSARRDSSSWQRYFEFTNDPGFTNGGNAKYLYFSTNGNVKANNGGETNSPDVGEDGGWHNWAVIIKNGSFTVYRDGSERGTISSDKLSSDWFNTIKNDGYILIGASSYSGDGAYAGCIKNFKVYDCALSSSQIGEADDDELFQWTFDSTLNERFTGSDNAAAVMQSWNGNYSNEGDHIYCKDSWLMSSVPSRMRQDAYKKHWRMDFDFNPTQDFGANRLELMPGITDKTGLDVNYNGGQSFGMSTNGKIYFRTTDFDNGAWGDTGLNLKTLYNNSGKQRVTVSYAYHDGVISVLVDWVLKFQRDVSEYKSFFENINTVTYPGRNGAGVYMDLWDFSCYSFWDMPKYSDLENENAANHLKGRYFLGDIEANFVSDDYDFSVSGSGATWAEADGIEGAHFNGGNSGNSPNYLYLPKNATKNMFRATNNYTGFTFSFMSKSIHDDSWQRIFELTNVGSAYSGGDPNQFLMFTSQYDGSTHLRYKGAAATLNVLGGITAWHVWTVTVQNGTINIYRDGENVRSDSSSNYNAAWFNEVLTNGQILLGASTYSDAGFDGYIRDLRIYDIALSASQVSSVYTDTYNNRTYFDGIPDGERDTYINNLASAISSYESKMGSISSDFLTNTKAAYDAYVVANRYYDALVYGESRKITINTVNRAINNLNTAKNNMGNWSYKNATAHGRFTSDADYVSDENYAQTYNKVIFASEVGSGESDSAVWSSEITIYGDKEKCNPRLFHPVAVLMYDDQSQPYIPVMSYFRHWCGGTANYKYNFYYSACFISANGNGLTVANTKWRNGSSGSDESFNYQWNYLKDGGKEVNVLNYDQTDTNQHWSKGFWGSTSWNLAYANQLKFTGSMGNNEFLRTITPQWGFNFWNQTSNMKKERINGSKSIYVINYKVLRDSISTAKNNYCRNIANYKEGQLSTMFQGCDEATAIDPQGGYSWSKDNAASNASTVANRISTAVGHINTIGDNALYPALRAEMKGAHANHPTGNTAYYDYTHYWDIYDTYTPNSMGTFWNAYYNAQWHMEKLATNNYYWESSADNNRRLSELVDAHAGLKRRASFTALDSAYSAAKSAQSALDISPYTTSSVSAYNTYLNTAGNFPYYTRNSDDRANTSTDNQTDIDNEASLLSTAQSRLLVRRASFTALDSAYSAKTAEFAALTAGNYTTSTYNAANTFLTTNGNFPYHFKTEEQKADTADSYQGAIDSEETSINNALNGLERRADFSELDAAKKVWTDYLTDHSAEYTTSSKTELSNYINSTSEFELENTADRADTGVSRNDDIEDEIDKYEAIDASDYLERVADLTYFDAEFDKANTFLLNLNGKTAEYTADSVQAVVDAVTAVANAEGANKSVQTIATANAAARADFGQAVQTDANYFADDIKDAMAGLEKVETVTTDATTADVSAFEAAVAILNNVDPDAYDVTAGDVASIRRRANATISSDETQISYGSATINVLNGEISQEDINDATQTILDSLTVHTKTYAVTKDNEGSTDFDISAKSGTFTDGTATYGTTIVADSGDPETAWFLEIRTGSMHKELAFQGYGQRLQTKVLGTTKIKAVKKVSEQKRVKIVRKYGDNPITDKSPVQLVGYVAAGETFGLPAAPAIAFYEFSGYYYSTGGDRIDNPEEAYPQNTEEITDDTVIYAKYTVKSGADCAINVQSDAAQNRTVAYNTKVSLTGAENTYGWVEAIDATHYRPFKIGKDVEFFASESTELKAVTKSEFDAFNFTLPCVNLRKGGVIEVDGKKTFNAQLLKDGYDIQEYGILIAAPYSPAGSTPISMDNLLPSMVIIENSGKHTGENAYQILRAKSTKLVGAGQFTIGVNSLPANYIYRGYAIYKDSNGNLQTVYSEAMR